MMSEAEKANLIRSMQDDGYDATMPIVLHEDLILDGRNRYEAAQAAGVEPVFTTYEGTDPLAFVVRHNLHRRHLNESQRAVVANKLATIEHGGNRGANQHESWQGANLRLGIKQSEAADMLNVSRRMVQTIRAIEQQAPELIPFLESGEMTANEARKEIKRIAMESYVQTTQNVGDEWYTPKWLFDALGLHFDIDVCSPIDATHVNVPYNFRYTILDDGLQQPWEGIVWCNPPYSDSEPWANKMIEHNDGILLTHVPMNALWASKVWQSCRGLRLFQAMEFVRPDGSPERPGYWLMIAAFGNEAHRALRDMKIPDALYDNLRRVPSPYFTIEP